MLVCAITSYIHSATIHPALQLHIIFNLCNKCEDILKQTYDMYHRNALKLLGSCFSVAIRVFPLYIPLNWKLIQWKYSNRTYTNIF